MLRVILADDEQYERNYLEKVIKESYPGLRLSTRQWTAWICWRS